MSLYNTNFKKMDIDLSKIERLNSVVTNAIIYRYEDIILKKYWICTQYAIRERMFEVLSQIHNKHLMELYEMFYVFKDDDVDKYINLKKREGHLVIDGYTAKYYHAEDINPITKNSDYLLCNIVELRELIDIMSKYKIVMDDTKPENTIINSDGIVLIDPDYYRFTDNDTNTVINHNYRELLMLLKLLFEDYAEDYVHEINSYFDELPFTNPISAIEQIETSLKRVRRPIQLIDKNL